LNKNYSSCFIFKYTEILSVAPRHIFNSLLDAWPIQASRLRDIQRRWPVLDATAPRGSLRPHHDQQSIPNRRSRTTQVPLASLASVPLPPPREDGTIPLPQVPNVAAEKIRDLASNGYRQANVETVIISGEGWLWTFRAMSAPARTANKL